MSRNTQQGSAVSEETGKTPDILERGAPVDGQPQTAETRLYMQLNVFTLSGAGFAGQPGQPRQTRTMANDIAASLEDSGLDAAVYLDVNDPVGIGVLFLAEDPDTFVSDVRNLLTGRPFDVLDRRGSMTMLGRTYSMGFEPDLMESLIHRPRNTVLNPDWPWAIWYPLRRNGAFARLEHKEQRQILMEHAHIGRAYGRADFAHDIRLACYGLDAADNDFVIGLIGKDLYPLSRVVQDMRKTQQTALYIDSLGPFFVGKKTWSSDPLRSSDP
ncbi:MAG: chlorite dismutase family protein [Gemmatimonadetes bacterium]|nr:chlorite dismutase family protein [Gemmatimonadota bacterium]MYG15042.1 chlorite dismutase family protein [Gemmatimonadota bacterium]